MAQHDLKNWGVSGKSKSQLRTARVSRSTCGRWIPSELETALCFETNFYFGLKVLKMVCALQTCVTMESGHFFSCHI